MNQAISVLNKIHPAKIWNAFRRWPIIPVAILSILLLLVLEQLVAFGYSVILAFF